jgi:RNA polymerase sigma-70 factor (ECF subfamily)
MDRREPSPEAPVQRPKRSRRVTIVHDGRDTEFAAYYRQSVIRLVGFLIWLGVPPMDAPDVAQEAMIEAYRHWDTIRAPDAWVRRVASRKWLARVADPRKETPVDPLPEHTGLLSEPTSIDSVEQRHDIVRLLAKLPPRQRQILAWHLDGYSGPEIAAELGISHDTVRANLLKARRAVVTLHAKEGGHK